MALYMDTRKFNGHYIKGCIMRLKCGSLLDKTDQRQKIYRDSKIDDQYVLSINKIYLFNKRLHVYSLHFLDNAIIELHSVGC